MTKILVLYYSRHGSVAEMANHIAHGIESVENCEAVMRTVPAVSTVNEAVESAIASSGDVYATVQDLESCDGLLLGSPTRFGTIAAPLKFFFDQSTSQWLSGALNDKPAGVFTSSGSMHGGQESTLLGMMLPLMHHGMLMLGLPFFGTALSHTKRGGTPYGASHVAGGDNNAMFNSDEIQLCHALGRRVAATAVALNGAKL